MYLLTEWEGRTGKYLARVSELSLAEHLKGRQALARVKKEGMCECQGNQGYPSSL